MAIEITQEQINGFRMDRHCLTSRAKVTELESLVSQVCGIQAQMPTAANLQLWVRTTNLTPEAVSNELWNSKKLIRTWCMRGTAHYLPTTDYHIYLKAIIEPQFSRHREWLTKRGMREFGEITKSDFHEYDFETILAAVVQALSDGPATRNEVADFVAEKIGADARRWVETGYYIVTKLLAFEGKVSFGPDLDGKSSLVLTDHWLPNQPSIETEVAEDAILTNYLASYGPATPQDFAAWSGLKMTRVKPIWKRNIDNCVKIICNEKPRWVLRRDLDPLLNTSMESRPIRLLPHFDIFLLGHKDKSHIVEQAHYKRVFKKAAWIAPVLLSDGQAIGIWKQKRTTKKLVVTIEPFKTLTKSQLHDIEVETQRLGDYYELSPEVQMKT